MELTPGLSTAVDNYVRIVTKLKILKKKDSEPMALDSKCVCKIQIKGHLVICPLYSHSHRVDTEAGICSGIEAYLSGLWESNLRAIVCLSVIFSYSTETSPNQKISRNLA